MHRVNNIQMTAKEEHLRNLEMHKLTRNQSEMSKKNILLEMECVKLRENVKTTAEKYGLLTKQCNEKMEEMQRHFEETKERLDAEAKKEAALQRIRHFDAVNEIKRQLETIYNGKVDENKRQHDGLMQQLMQERVEMSEEREKLKRDFEEESRKLAEKRTQLEHDVEETRMRIKQELNDLQMRMTKDEHEMTIRLVLEMDVKREKMMQELENNRKEMHEQLEKEFIEKKQTWDDEIVELKKQTELACREQLNHKMNALEAEIQKLECERNMLQLEYEKRHEWEEQLKKKEEDLLSWKNEQVEVLKKREMEQMAQHENLLEQLKDKETEQSAFHNEKLQILKQKEQQQTEAFTNDMKLLNEERQQLKTQIDEAHEQIKRDERENQTKFLMHMKTEREKFKGQLEKEKQEADDEIAAQRKLNAEAFEKSFQELELKFQSRVAENLDAHNSTVQHLNRERDKERDQMKQIIDDLLNKKKQIEIEYSKIKEMQAELKLEKERVTEKAKKNAEEMHASNDKIMNEKKRENDELFKSVMNKQQARYDDAIRKLNDETERVKKNDFIRENEHAQLLRKTTVELAEKTRQNSEDFMKSKADLDARFNDAMKTLNEEREKLKRQLQDEEELGKRHELEKEKLKEGQEKLEKDRAMMVEQANKNAVIMHKSKLEELAFMKSELEAKFKAAIEEQKNAFDAQTQKQKNELDEEVKKMNKEREILAQRENNMRNSVLAKISVLNNEFEKQRNKLTAEMNDKINAQLETNEEILSEKKKQCEDSLRVIISRHENAHAHEMRKLNNEIERVKENDLIRENEHAQLFQKTKADLEEKTRKNSEDFMKARAELDARFNDTIHKLNENIDRVKENDFIRKNEHTQLLQKAKEELAEKTRQNSEALLKARAELDARLNVALNKLNDERQQYKGKLEAENEEMLNKLKMEQTAKFNTNLQVQKNTYEELMKKLKEDVNVIKGKLEDEYKELINNHLIEREKLNNELNEEWFQKNKQLSASIENTRHFHNECMKIKLEIAIEKTALNEMKEKMVMEHEHAMQNVREMHEEMNKKQRHVMDDNALLDEKIKTFESDLNLLNEQKSEFNKLQDQQNKYIKTLIAEVYETKRQSEKECEALMKSNDSLREQLSSDKMNQAITANFAHVQLINGMDFNNKRVMIYSHYSKQEQVESYNLLMLEYIEKHFDYIIILTNCSTKWNIHNPNYNKIHILSYDLKSDFRNYGLFIIQNETKLANVSSLFLINDSFIVVDVNAFSKCIRNLFEVKIDKHDFIGLTSSHENVFHVQSFFLCFNASTLQTVFDYFKTTGLPENHDAAISKYELKLTLHLMNHGFSQYAFVSNDDMPIPLNTTCCKWSEVLNTTGIVKRQHFFKKYAYRHMAMSDNDIYELAETHSYNKHFIDFLKYNNVKLVPPPNQSKSNEIDKTNEMHANFRLMK